jgi:hypothetical protein
MFLVHVSPYEIHRPPIVPTYSYAPRWWDSAFFETALANRSESCQLVLPIAPDW